jgi:hypothetical protein
MNLQWSSNGEKTGDININLDTSATVPNAQFVYRYREGGGDWEEMSYKFNLVPLVCNFGGKRWFFRCGLYKNGVFCGRRVAKLYQVGKYFGCRHCAELSYSSCNENKKGVFSFLLSMSKGEECFEKLKRYSYAGRPTKKYLRCLRLSNRIPSEQSINALKVLANRFKER